MTKPYADSQSDSQNSVDYSIIGSLLDFGIDPAEQIESGEFEEDKYNLFEQNPVDIETFLYGENYLNLNIRLSVPQLELVDQLSNIFDPPLYTEGVLMAGQGSGKDTCSIFINLRIIYLLHCLKSPQRFFNMDTNSFIDSINVAPNADLAKNIYFSTLSNVLRAAPLFQEGTPFYIPHKMTANLVTFNKNIRLISGNSENEAWQGYTPILIVLDEIDAFKSDQELRRSKSQRAIGAEGVYDTAKSLVQSRFPGTGKIISLSWPRFKGSFIQKRFLAGQTEKRTYVSCKPTGEPYATWDFNPSKKKEDFVDFYETDPVLARARFECDPPFARDAFIKETDSVLLAFDAVLDSVTEKVTHAGVKPIREVGMMDKKHKYYIHVDLGLRHSNAALGIAHREENKIVLDLIRAWIPEPEKDVHFKDIENFILDLRDEGYKILSVTYDNYQSVSSLQELQSKNIPAKYKSVTRTREAYDTFKDLIYQNKIDGYFDEEVIEEILGLDVIYGERVEARPGMKKDRADAAVGAIHGVLRESSTVTGMRIMGSIAPIYTNPDVIAKEAEQNKNTNLYDPRKDFGADSVKARVVSSVPDTCTLCQRIGGIEYSDIAGNRLLDSSLAVIKMCIICGTKWSLDSEGWEIIKPPDEVSLREVAGISVNGNS